MPPAARTRSMKNAFASALKSASGNVEKLDLETNNNQRSGYCQISVIVDHGTVDEPIPDGIVNDKYETVARIPMVA